MKKSLFNYNRLLACEQTAGDEGLFDGTLPCLSELPEECALFSQLHTSSCSEGQLCSEVSNLCIVLAVRNLCVVLRIQQTAGWSNLLT